MDEASAPPPPPPQYGTTAAVDYTVNDALQLGSVDDKGDTALIRACRNGSENTALSILIAGKANADHVDGAGQTALDYARRNNMANVVLLLDAGHKVEPVQAKIDRLRQIGQIVGANTYETDTGIVDLAMLNLTQQFESNCLVASVHVQVQPGGWGDYSIDSRLYQTLLFGNGSRTSDDRVLSNQIASCVKRGSSVVVMRLSIGAINFGHANLLIYRPLEQTVERFEPYGGDFTRDDDEHTEILREIDETTDEILRKFVEEKLSRKLGGKLTYLNAKLTCPAQGPQALENTLREQTDHGYCAMWTMLVMEMIISDPKKPTRQIVEEVLEHTAKDPWTLKDVIRGYAFQVQQNMDRLFRQVGHRSGFSYFFDNMNVDHMYHPSVNEWANNTLAEVDARGAKKRKAPAKQKQESVARRRKPSGGGGGTKRSRGGARARRSRTAVRLARRRCK